MSGGSGYLSIESRTCCPAGHPMEVKAESCDCQEKNVPDQPSCGGPDVEVCRDGRRLCLRADEQQK